jgi:hypothetical protein
MPVPPQVPVVELAPDWTCEFISESHEARDRIEKARIYFGGEAPHYWLMNSHERTLEVLRRTDIGYALVQTGQSGERIRAEPFDAVEFGIDELFGDDPLDDSEQGVTLRKPRSRDSSRSPRAVLKTSAECAVALAARPHVRPESRPSASCR